MKTRFNTFDLMCIVAELKQYEGMRVNQVYDIDKKTYLIRLQKPEEKVVFQLESGNRINTTDFDWPKNSAPSGFTMKLRKHLRNKRLEYIRQVGLDRIVDLQFGSGEAAHHIFLELFDKGNIILTDHDLLILNVLRPHAQDDRHRVVVKEKYPIDKARSKREKIISVEELRQLFINAKPGDQLRKVLTPHFEYGPALIDHALLGVGLSGSLKIDQDVSRHENDFQRIIQAYKEAEAVAEETLSGVSKGGFIIQRLDRRPQVEEGKEDEILRVNVEYHPRRWRQHEDKPFIEYPTFDKAVDMFYSTLEGQQIEVKLLQQERDALKKLENVRRDHSQRLDQLERNKEVDRVKAELILANSQLVDKAILFVQTALANQMSWQEISALVKATASGSGLSSEAQSVAKCIKDLHLQSNQIVLQLTDPYDNEEEEEEEEDYVTVSGKTSTKNAKQKSSIAVTIDLDLSAYANARKYFDQKRSATKKQQKTVESQCKALKSAEKKTKKSLLEMKTIVNITKTRKVYWFEKFFWFISSENYLVIGGRDMMQNELIVKRYMSPGDIYVHADLHGASSVVVKNPTREPIPPKTINEAGIMAICYSVAWEAKVITTAWWVHSDQVLKTAPSGEYLPTGSFVIRGKKNFLPSTNLILGFSFLFKLEESSIARHEYERKIRGSDGDNQSLPSNVEDDVEIVLSDDEDDSDSENRQKDIEEERRYDEGAGEDEDEDEDEDENENEDGDEDEDEYEEQEEEDKEIIDFKIELNSTEGEKDLFPDTEIKIHHIGKEMQIETKSTSLTIGNEKVSNNYDEYNDFVFLGDNKPVPVPKLTLNKKKTTNKTNNTETVVLKNELQKDQDETGKKLKRGQKSKLKKIKGKYKDQDEEDRQLRASLLQQLQESNAALKKTKRKGKKKADKEKKLQQQQQYKPQKKSQAEITDRSERIPEDNDNNRNNNEEEDEEGQVSVTGNTDLAMLPSLTGIPHPEDELLFAIPVVAPYNTLQNYKFKVKLTPGTGKRGKAVKTALAIFLKEKTTTAREKDLLKSVKDSDLSRNLPGKVKLSAPQLHGKK